MAWLALAATLRPDPWRDLVPWVTTIVVLAPLCVVPLALRMVLDERDVALKLILLGAPCAAVSALCPVGWPAACLSAVWLLVSLVVAWRGLVLGYQAARCFSIADLAIAAGCLYLPIGAAWLVASRLGIPVWQFAEPVVALTAAHFHYAGFTAPVMAGLVGRRIGARWPMTFRTMVALVCIGPPLTALGITFSPRLETLSALLVSGGLLLLGTLMLAALLPQVEGWPRLLLAVAALTPFLTMAMAALYALRGHLSAPPPLLTTMAAVHGLANAVGFGLCGMLGLTLHTALSDDAGKA